MDALSYNTYLISKGNKATDEFLAHHGVLGMKWGIRKDGKPQGWQGDSNGKNKINPNDFVDNTKSAKTMEKKFKNDPNVEKVGKDLYMPKGYISDKKFKKMVVNHEQERLDSINSINRKYKEYNFPDMTRASNVMFLGMMYSSDKTTREPFRNMMHELDVSQRTNHKKYISDLKNFDDSKLSEKDKAVKKELLNAIERDDKDWDLTYTLAMATEKGLQNDEKINHSLLNEEFLSHHGVLGMHWGIRKDGKPQGWQGDGSGKSNNSSKASTKYDAKIKKLNEKYKGKEGSASKLEKASAKQGDKFRKEVWKGIHRELNKTPEGKAYKKMLGRKGLTPMSVRPSGGRSFTYNAGDIRVIRMMSGKKTFKPEEQKIIGDYFRKKAELVSRETKSNQFFKDLQKDEINLENIDKIETLRQLLDKEAMHRDQNDDYLMHTGSEMVEEFLAHHGVLGMKWGIRKDGKPQGWQGGVGNAAKKVGKATIKVAKGTGKTIVKGRAKVKEIQAKRNEKKRLEEARNNELNLEDKKRKVEASYKIASTTRSARALSRNMGVLTDAELNKRIERLKKENEVREMAAKERERGRSWVSRALENSAKQSFSNVTTYGMTKLGKQAIDGLLDSAISGSGGKDSKGSTNKSSGLNASSANKDSSSKSGGSKSKSSIDVTYNSKTYKRPSGRVKSNNRSYKSYGVSAISQFKNNNKTYGTSQPAESRTFSFGDVAYEDLFED